MATGNVSVGPLITIMLSEDVHVHIAVRVIHGSKLFFVTNRVLSFDPTVSLLWVLAMCALVQC